jgi:glycerol kinase
MSCILAIDQSTSATKAVLFDREGQLLGKASREHVQHYPHAGWVEHDANEIWQNVLTTVGMLLQQHENARSDIALVSIANQRETTVVFDRAGEPLHPAIVWQCRRGDAICAEQIRNGREPAVRARTGLRLDGYFSAPKLQWLVREHPTLAERLVRGDALIGTIDTYLIYKMTRGEVFATDHTNASRTLLYDIHRREWDHELCSWWQVPRDALADVRDCDAQFGSTTLEGLLPRAVPICGVMGDSQAALFAHRCFETGSAKATFGSGCSVLLNVGATIPPSRSGAVTALAWVQRGRATYALEGIVNCSAASLTWLRDQLGIIANIDEADAAALQAGEEQGVYLVPAFSGLGAPYWRDEARAAIVGLSAYSHRYHIIRAALEAIAYQVRDVLEMLQSEAAVRVHRLRCDGGPTRSDWLMQFTADLLGVELRLPQQPDCSALGAAMMGTLGAGWYSSPAALPELPQEEKTYRRKVSAEQANVRYRGWQHAVQQVLYTG